MSDTTNPGPSSAAPQPGAGSGAGLGTGSLAGSAPRGWGVGTGPTTDAPGSFPSYAPSLPLSTELPRGEQPGDVIGPYTLRAVLGEGGFGVVYLAERREPMVQRVALKLLKPGMDSRRVIARFEHERQALALMDHPNVARVFDGGTTAAGRPYFVMEYVDGLAITHYCDQQRLTVRDRLRLFIAVCEAVQHAHMKGIIHRDLKPSNILVTAAGGTPVPKVIDFGIAKALGGAGGDGASLATVQGAMIGTPEYMSPEQAETGAVDIDTRADVYSLGVVLYELLTGVLPFETRDLRSRSYAEVQRIIREVDPPRPSTRLGGLSKAGALLGKGEGAGRAPAMPTTGQGEAIASARGTAFGELVRQLRRELEWVPIKAMRKSREERYGTPMELAEDIRHYLAGRPLVAGPESAAYRARKFLRRNRVGVAAGSAVVAALVGGAGFATYGLIQARAERDRATQVAEFMRQTLSGVGPSVALGRSTELIRDLMDTAGERIARGELDGSPEAKIELSRTIGDTYRQIAEYERAEPLLVSAAEGARAGGDVSAAVEALLALGLLRQDQGRFDEAEALYDEASRRVAAFGSAGVGLRAEVVGKRAQAKSLQKDFVAAEALDREALALARQAYAGDHGSIAEKLGNLAGDAEGIGNLDEAATFREESLAMFRRLHGDLHPSVAVAMSNLAGSYLAQNKYEEAGQLLRDSLAIQRRLMAPKSPELALAVNNYAYFLSDRGKHDEAEPLFREAVAIYKASRPGDHPETAAAISGLGSALFRAGKLDGAIEHKREALAMSRRLHPGDHPDVAFGLNDLGAVLRVRGELAESAAALEECIAMRRRLVPIDESSLLGSLSNLAAVRRMQGNLPEAEKMCREVLDVQRRLSPGDSRPVAASLGQLGSVLALTGELGEAERLQRECVAMFARVLPGDHPDVLNNRLVLAGMLCAIAAQDAGERGREAAGEARAIARGVLDSDAAKANPTLAAEAKTSLAWALGCRAVGSEDEAAKDARFAEAEKLIVEGLDAMGPSTNIPVSKKRDAYQRAVKLYTAWGKPDQAAVWQDKIGEMAKPK